MTIDGSPMPDYGGEFPLPKERPNRPQPRHDTGQIQGQADLRRNGRLGGGVCSHTGPSASFSSREIGVPIKANTSEPLSLAELTHQISQIPGVAETEPLSFVDLAAGALSAGPKRPRGGSGLRPRPPIPGARSVDPHCGRLLRIRAPGCSAPRRLAHCPSVPAASCGSRCRA